MTSPSSPAVTGRTAVVLDDAVVLVIAKAPVAGQVKTRLTTAMSDRGAAEVAAAALIDTIETVRAAATHAVVLALAGDERDLPEEVRDGLRIVAQRGHGFDERLAHAFADAASGEHPVVLVGMDTPQLTVDHLQAAVGGLSVADAVLGPAPDGGWWVLALRDPHDAEALVGVPMSQDDTGSLTVEALERRGLVVGFTQPLVDVDTVKDALLVASEAPGSRFAAALLRALEMAS